MGLSATLLLGTGVLLGAVLPRLPMLILPRLRSLSFYFPPHPDPMPVNPHLVTRLVAMRRLWWSAVAFALMAMGVGVLLSWGGPDPLGFGLVLGGGWVALGRLLPAGLEPRWRTPYAMPLISAVSEISREGTCCGAPEPFWEVQWVRCRHCGQVLLEHPRPELGRRRSDGWVKGTLRLLLLDGKPAVLPNVTGVTAGSAGAVGGRSPPPAGPDDGVAGSGLGAAGPAAPVDGPDE